jgi:hypothetical protein
VAIFTISNQSSAKCEANLNTGSGRALDDLHVGTQFGDELEAEPEATRFALLKAVALV